MVLLDALTRAMICVALLWRWPVWAALTLLGHVGMLRPVEFLSARRRDLVLPSDAMGTMSDAYLHISRPKTRRVARCQHAKVSDRTAILVFEVTFGGLDPRQALSDCTHASYRRRWDEILQFLGVPCTEASGGPTPGIVRGSRA